jgi:parallel beta-helix repeat protein
MALGVILGIGMLGAIPGVALAAQPSCGDTLMANTTLTGPLDCSGYGGSPVLTLGKNGITLNLNGYTLTGFTGDDSNIGIYSEKNNITITNGTVWGSDRNVYLYYSTGAVISWLTVNDEAADPNENGIEIDYGVGNKLKHNTVVSDQQGIYLYGGASNVVKWNEATAEVAFLAKYDSKGMYAHNTAHGGYGFQDYYGGSSQYWYNTANGLTDDGFYLYCSEYGPVTAVGNTANNNGNDGFYTYECYVYPPGVPHLSLISGNTANDNGNAGFEDYYSIGATFSGNTARRNADGMYMDYPGDIRIMNNILRGNTDVGLELLDNYGTGYGIPKRISGNTIRGNDYGINASYGVPNGVCFNNTIFGNTSQNLIGVICN